MYGLFKLQPFAYALNGLGAYAADVLQIIAIREGRTRAFSTEIFTVCDDGSRPSGSQAGQSCQACHGRLVRVYPVFQLDLTADGP